jgi:hypothetical protein
MLDFTVELLPHVLSVKQGAGAAAHVQQPVVSRLIVGHEVRPVLGPEGPALGRAHSSA